MAFTIILTKKEITKIQDKLFSIVYNLSYQDDLGNEVINQDLSMDYNSDGNNEKNIARFEGQVKKVIVDYQEIETVKSDATVDTAIMDIYGKI